MLESLQCHNVQQRLKVNTLNLIQTVKIGQVPQNLMKELKFDGEV